MLIRKQFTLPEAKSTRAFLVYGLILAFNSFFITGLTFHIVSVFASEGFPKADAISIFLPASVIAVTISTIANFLSDYLQLRLYLYLMIFGGIVVSIGFLYLPTTAGIPLLVTGFGIMSGFFCSAQYHRLAPFFWPYPLGRYYGQGHVFFDLGKCIRT